MPPASDSSFVHLRARSEFSLSEGLFKIKALVAQVAALGMPAVALADRGNLYGLIKFYSACLEQGVKPLIGCEIMVQPDPEAGQPLPAGAMLLLVRNSTGYRNLLELISKAHLAAGSEQPTVQEAWCAEHAEGLLALAGGAAGTIGKLLLGAKPALAATWLQRCRALWGDAFYLEIQQAGRPQDEPCLHRTLTLADSERVPVVATHDVCFKTRKDFAAHEARVCIQEGRVLADTQRPQRHSAEQYMKSPSEMATLFADYPEALLNSVEIAKRCTLELTTGQYHLPVYPVSAGETEDAMLARLALAGMEERVRHTETTEPATIEPVAAEPAAAEPAPAVTSPAPATGAGRASKPWQEYLERLNFETQVIASMGFAGYFLIVMEFVRWAKEQRIPVGPGRGSGAGSLVAYALGITDIDPLQYDLLFERFLNPERKSMPDFDIDFCIEGRDQVIAHVVERYGQETVSQIVTFGTMAAKAVVRDVTRVQGKPYGLGDKLAKLIPFAPDITLAKAMAEEQALSTFVAEDDAAGEIMDMAFKLEGIARSVGKHPGGVVIAPGRLSHYAPLTMDEHQIVLTQFDKDDVESVGLVKFDFLGLRNLTIINRSVQAVNARHAPEATALVIENIPLDDADTFELLQNADTKAVFQLESRGMRDLIKRLKPSEFEDLVALVALYRPGPLNSGMAGDFIDRRHGKAKVSYLHPDLEPVLARTYGVILYQEQVMQIAQVLAEYSLGDADILRRAMGKKKPAEMAKERIRFLAGAAKRGIKQRLANHIFDLMEEFAGYGFNRSHSVGYALIAYQTAWLKRHYPVEYMAVVLSSEMQKTDLLCDVVADCKAMKLSLLPPDVNTGSHEFTVSAANDILYGLGAIKGMGKSAVRDLIANREAGGPFQDLFDLCRRLSGRRAKRVNKQVLEALIKAGALDALPGALTAATAAPHRAALLEHLEEALKYAEQQARDQAAGQGDMLGDQGGDVVVRRPADAIPAWSKKETLQAEQEVLGLYLGDHPVSLYQAELSNYAPGNIAALVASRNSKKLVGGLVVAIRKKRTRDHGNMAFMTLEDATGRVDVILQSGLFQKHAHWLEKNQVIVAGGTIEPDAHTGNFRMRAASIKSLTMLRAAAGIWLDLDGRQYQEGVGYQEMLTRLAAILREYKGNGCHVNIHYRGACARADIVFGQDWSVLPSDELLAELSGLLGAQQVHLG